jgi:hypothetical protein
MYTERRTGWKSWEVDPVSQWDFALLVTRYREHALANPGLAMPTDIKTIEDMMDLANALRYLQIPGADMYVTRTGESAPKILAPVPDRQGRGVLASVVGRARNIAAGQRTLSEWWGEGGKPVLRQVANERAKICADCPQNGSGGLLAVFTVEAAAKIQHSFEELNDQKMATPHDERLGVCKACDCPLRLKVWTPMVHILKNMPADQKNKLDPKCWIL